MPSVPFRLITSLLAATVGCAHATSGGAPIASAPRANASSTSASSAPTAAPEADATGSLAYPVAVTMGDTELVEGDALVIAEVRGTEPRLRVGGTYVVRGRYTLRSHPRAALLLGVTVEGAPAAAPASRESRIHIAEGEGDFELRIQLPAPGHPHLTFYGDDGRPFGGVYFGEGDWLLRKKGWRYHNP